MSIWQENAAAFATRPATAVDALRNAGIRHYLRLTRLGRPDLARRVLLRSVQKQARLLGIRDVPLPSTSTGEPR